MLAVVGLSVAALLQSTVMEVLPAAWPQPDLVALLVLAWASLKGRAPGLRGALLGGLLMDVFSSNPLGLAVLVLLPGAYIAGWIREQLPEPVFVASISTVIVGSVIVALGQAAYLIAAGGIVSWQTMILRVVLPLAVVNGLLGALLLPALYALVEAPERDPTAFLRRTLPRGLWQ